MNEQIKIGDKIIYRPSFGLGGPTIARVTGIEVSENPREKYGTPVDSVSMEIVKENRAIFMLDDGHWMYSDQFNKIVKED